MDFKKAVRFEELKAFFEDKGFSVEKDHGDYFFENKYGLYFCPHSNNLEPDKIYLDSNIECYGCISMKRTWSKNGMIYDYLTKEIYPIMKNLRGPYFLENEEIVSIVKDELSANKISYELLKDYEYEYYDCMPINIVKRTNKADLIEIKSNNKRYGLNIFYSHIILLEFIENTNERFTEYPWYKFSPTYLEGEECVRTVVKNMIEFIDKYNC